MNSMSLPNYPYKISPSDFDSEPKVHSSFPFISSTLKSYLDSTKAEIGERVDRWDMYKRYTNPHEYVHTVVPGTRNAVCRKHTISRAFFKLHEILIDCSFNLKDAAQPSRTFHLAEGPGGFIEAVRTLRQQSEHPSDIHVGMTLVEDGNGSVPGWSRLQNYLSRNPTIKIEVGKTGTGDLLEPSNLMYCHHKYENTMELITGDGGFDFSGDYNRQEIQSLPLLLAQVFYAVSLQRHGGTLVVKVFDMFSHLSVDIAFLLNSLYKVVCVHKPYTSRSANSERYLVCRGFRLRETKSLTMVFHDVLLRMQADEGKPPSRLFSFPIPRYFLDKLQEVNAAFGQQQIENIKSTLGLIRNPDPDRLDQLKKSGIHRCVVFCQKYDLPHGKQSPAQNVFLTKFPDPVYDEQPT